MSPKGKTKTPASREGLVFYITKIPAPERPGGVKTKHISSICWFARSGDVQVLLWGGSLRHVWTYFLWLFDVFRRGFEEHHTKFYPEIPGTAGDLPFGSRNV